MRRLIFLPLLLAAGALFAQDNLPAPLNQAAVRLDGGPVITIVDTVTPQAANAFLGAPDGSSGPPTFRLFSAGDNLVLGQATSPGTAQNWNFNITGGSPGKGLANKFEVPSLGTFCGTSLGCIVMSSVDGRIGIQTNAGNNTSEFTMGGVGTTNADLKTSTTETIVQTVGGNSWPFRMTQWRQGTAADTSASISLSTTATYTTSYHACDTTSNTVAYTLPAAANTGTFFFIKHVAGATNPCTFVAQSTDKVDGLAAVGAPVSLPNIGDWVLVHDSSNGNIAWQIIAGNIASYANSASGAENCASYSNTPNGAQMRGPCMKTELLTLSTGATTTATTMTIPANSIVTAIEIRAVIGITTAANFTVKLTSNSTGAVYALIGTATTTNTNININNTSSMVPVLSADSYVSAAGTTTITITTNVNPGAGQLRITPYYYTVTPPAS